MDAIELYKKHDVSDKYSFLIDKIKEKGYKAYVFEGYNPLLDWDIREGMVEVIALGRKKWNYVTIPKVMLEDVDFIEEYIAKELVNKLEDFDTLEGN